MSFTLPKQAVSLVRLHFGQQLATSNEFLASAALWLTLDAGQFEALELNEKTGALRVGLAPGTQYMHAAQLRIEQPAKIAGAAAYHPSKSFQQVRGAYMVPLGTGTTWVELIH